jgi:pimeloyl-ACP methyl ester carboxylesterase
MRRRVLATLVILRIYILPVLLPVLGCARWMPARIPMRAVDYPSPDGDAKCLIVFLPGMGDSAEVFEQRGFVDQIRRRRLAADLVAANATIGYYARGIVVDRLAEDVIAPRRARGSYQQTWLIGPSMGGFGALFYSRQRPGEITGLLALAPYLGDRELIEEIHQAGGLRKWKAPPRVEPMNETNYRREVWRWLQAVTDGKEEAPIINVGFGSEDKLAFADELLATELPHDRVYRTRGGHHWDPWRALLVQFLDRGDLSRGCH